jgi:hypothetical protein
MKTTSPYSCRCATSFVAIVIAALLTGPVRGDFQSLSKRLPADSNVLVAVNVEKLLASPYGQKHEWAANMAEKWQSRPLMVPPGVSRLLMGADLDPKTIDPNWQVCLMEMAQMPSLDSLAQAHRGYVDRVWDKNAIVSPQNAYFVPLDDKTLASLTPASRRAIAKWVREPVKPDGNLTSAYLKTIILGLNDDTDVMMALDLEGAFAVPSVRRWLGDSEIPELKGKDLDAIARLFGQFNGIMLNVKVGQDITAKAIASFNQDATTLNSVAKPIMIDILKFAGMRLQDVDDWKFTTSGKNVSMEGKLSEESLRLLLGLVQSPMPTQGASESMASQNPNDKTSALDPAVASQRYYKFICQILDNLSAKQSLSETSTWFRNSARRIEQAPILNVDPALVEWGAMVTSRLKEVSALTAVGQTSTSARNAGLQSSAVDYGAYTYDADGVFLSKISAEGEANRQQRRQAASEQKAQSQQQGLQILKDIPESRAKVRMEMTNKYKIEF